MFQIFGNIGTIPFVNGNPVSTGNKPDNLLSGKRSTTIGESNQAVVYPFDDNPFHRTLALFLGCNNRFCRRTTGTFQVDRIILTNPRHQSGKQNPAIPYCRKEIIQGVGVIHFGKMFVNLLPFLVTQTNDISANFSFQKHFAFGNIFIPPLFFEPGTDFGARLAGFGNIQPISGRTLALLIGSNNFNNFPIFYTVVNGNNPTIRLSPHHTVSNGGVNRIRKVNNRCPCRQIGHISLGRKYKYFIQGKVVFYAGNQFISFSRLPLGIQQLTNPRQMFIHVSFRSTGTYLVFPVSGDPEFCCTMHIPSTNLHFKGNPFSVNHGGVQGLVLVLFGSRNIILKPTGNQAEHIVNYAQHVVAFIHRIHNHPHGINIVNFVKAFALHKHFTINTVDGFYPSFDLHLVVNVLGQFFRNPTLQRRQKLHSFLLPHGKRVENFGIAHRV